MFSEISWGTFIYQSSSERGIGITEVVVLCRTGLMESDVAT